MASLFRRAMQRRSTASRSIDPLSFSDWMQSFAFGGLSYPFSSGSLSGSQEQIEASFSGHVEGAYKRNGVVFACMAARLLIFSEALFQFRRRNQGRPGDLFGTAALGILERPWPGGTTGDLLARMITDVDLAGNFYATRRPPSSPGGDPWLERLRPDWVTIILGDGAGLDLEVVGYAYQPGGPGSGKEPVYLLPEQVAHFAPIPDPNARYRGMSWLTPVLDEITSDGAQTGHKQKFYEQGATPNLVVTLGDTNLTPEKFEVWVDKMEASHAGWENAYKTLYLAAGADAKVIGTDLREADFKVVQGHGETRIAAAARVPPVIVGLSEGLDAATYSNYAQAKRAFADGTIRPLWRNAAGSLARLVDVPSGSHLWYDDRDVPFLREDMKDEAEIAFTESQTIRQLIDGGFTPESVTKAVLSNDWNLLEHTGLYSVQLQAPGSSTPGNADTPAQLPAPAQNGANGMRLDGFELLSKFAERNA